MLCFLSEGGKREGLDETDMALEANANTDLVILLTVCSVCLKLTMFMTQFKVDIQMKVTPVLLLVIVESQRK